MCKATAGASLVPAEEQMLIHLVGPIHKEPSSSTANTAATLALRLVDSECTRWAKAAANPSIACPAQLLPTKRFYSKFDAELAQLASRSPSEVFVALAPFIQAALGAAPAATHDAAARALSAVVNGTIHSLGANESLQQDHQKLHALLTALSNSTLHREPPLKPPPRRELTAADATTPVPNGSHVRIGGLSSRPELNGCLGSTTTFDAAKGRYGVAIDGGKERISLKASSLTLVSPDGSVSAEQQPNVSSSGTDETCWPSLPGLPLHDILTLSSGDSLYVMPSLTRHGAAVLPVPPHVISLLREQYFLALGAAGGVTADPTHYQKRATDASPIYDGERLSSPLAVAPADSPKPRTVVEWAALPEALHATVLEELRPLAEAWCGHALAPVRFFGVRRYLRGAALDAHVDSDPRVRAIGISVTVDIEGLDAPWPLAAEGAQGEAAGAPLPVGQCFVYEACRVRHHRPMPLRAEVFANAFVHYTLPAWVES